MWQLAHVGGFAMPPGPCGRWQVAQSIAPCFVFASLVWQLAHAGVFAGMCGSWQLAHCWCPAGAELASGLWQVAHAGGFVAGA